MTETSQTPPPPDNRFNSKPFSVKSKSLFYHLFAINAKPWIIVGLLGIVATIIPGFIVSYKWFLVTLLWICIFIPMMMVFLYFFYGLLPLTALNSIIHKVALYSGKAVVTTCREDDEGNLTEDINTTIDYNNLKRILLEPDVLILVSNEPTKGLLILPVSEFPDRAAFYSYGSRLIRNHKNLPEQSPE